MADHPSEEAGTDGADPGGADPGGERVRLLYPPAGGAHAAALGQVTAAFNTGDYRRARALCRRVLAADDGSEEERAFAAQMAHRTGVDPLALVVGAVSLVALVVAVATGVGF